MGAPSKEEYRREMFADGLDPIDDEPKCPLCGGLLESKRVVWDAINETYVHEECYESCKPYMTQDSQQLRNNDP